MPIDAQVSNRPALAMGEHHGRSSRLKASVLQARAKTAGQQLSVYCNVRADGSKNTDWGLAYRLQVEWSRAGKRVHGECPKVGSVGTLLASQERRWRAGTFDLRPGIYLLIEDKPRMRYHDGAATVEATIPFRVVTVASHPASAGAARHPPALPAEELGQGKERARWKKGSLTIQLTATRKWRVRVAVGKCQVDSGWLDARKQTRTGGYIVQGAVAWVLAQLVKTPYFEANWHDDTPP